MSKKRFYNRLIAFIVAVAMIIAIMPLQAVSVFADDDATITPTQPTVGDGTTNNPYQISNANELYWFATEVNGGKTSINAKLTDDITVNEKVLESDGSLVADTTNLKTWTPIGSVDNTYSGTFDGQGHTISGLYFNASIASIGLFGSSYGIIKNVGVKDFYFYGGATRVCWVGGICGSNTSMYATTGTISNSYAIGCIKSGVYAGGICGYSVGTVKDCYAMVNLTAGTAKGGICGYSNNSSVSNSYYLSGTAENGIGTGTGSDTSTAKTEAQFNSGEVCYLLNGSESTSDAVWKQTIGEDSSPVFSGDIVYAYDATDGKLYGNGNVIKSSGVTVTAADISTLGNVTVNANTFEKCDAENVVVYVKAGDETVYTGNVTKKYVVDEDGGVRLDTTSGSDYKFSVVVDTTKFGGTKGATDFLEEVDVIANETNENNMTKYTENEDDIEFKVDYSTYTIGDTVRGQVQVKKWANAAAEKPIDDIIYYVTKIFTVGTDGTII
jgi:hypothetical protein